MQYNVKNLLPNEERLLDNIVSAISEGTRAHSYIIEGGTAQSRLKCGIYTACAVTCKEKVSGLPCLECPSCRKILCGEHMDVEVIGKDTESVKDEIKVDEIRRLRKDAYVLPTDGDYHIYIIAECNRMNERAQNALLKVLEEPPESVLFLLLTASKESLLPTVTSRAMSLSLGNGGFDETFEAICDKFPNKDKELCKRAAKIQVMLDNFELDGVMIDRLDGAVAVAEEFFVKGNRRINELLPRKSEELTLCLYILALAARDICVAKKNSSVSTVILAGSQLQTAVNMYTVKKALALYTAFSAAAERISAFGNTNAVLSELFTALRK